MTSELIDVHISVVESRFAFHDRCFDSLKNQPIVLHKQYGFKSSDDGRRAGIRLGNNKYLSWVDDDDWINPEYYRKAVEVLEQNQHLCGVFGSEVKVICDTPDGDIYYDVRPAIDDVWTLEKHISTGLYYHNSVVLRREAVEPILPFLDEIEMVEKMLLVAATWYGPYEHIKMEAYYWRQHHGQHNRTYSGEKMIRNAIDAGLNFVKNNKRKSDAHI